MDPEPAMVQGATAGKPVEAGLVRQLSLDVEASGAAPTSGAAAAGSATSSALLPSGRGTGMIAVFDRTAADGLSGSSSGVCCDDGCSSGADLVVGGRAHTPPDNSRRRSEELCWLCLEPAGLQTNNSSAGASPPDAQCGEPLAGAPPRERNGSGRHHHSSSWLLLTQACRCPRKVHLRCLARWQFHCAGKE